jgi:hypothetical protein
MEQRQNLSLVCKELPTLNIFHVVSKRQHAKPFYAFLKDEISLPAGFQNLYPFCSSCLVAIRVGMNTTS